MTKTAALKQKLLAKAPPKKQFEKGSGLSTGVVTLNLATSGRPHFALIPGHGVLFVGDSQAGKSWLARQIMAEACKNPWYAKHRLIDDDAEHGVLMDCERYFGREMARRVEAPTKHGSSRTLDECYANVVDAMKAGPCIYLIDSEDALYPEAQAKRMAKASSLRKAGKIDEAKGSYNTDKARLNSSSLPLVNDLMERTGSILIIIKQTRDNIGFDAMFNPKTRSGGRALTFYASLEMWFSIRGKIRKTVRKKQRVVGSYLKVHVKKNRVAGRDRTAVFPFYPGSGVDDTGAMVDFLIEEGHWASAKKREEDTTPDNSEGEGKKPGGKLACPEFDFIGTKDALVELIEAKNLEKQLRRITVDVFDEIEAGCLVARKARYS